MTLSDFIVRVSEFVPFPHNLRQGPTGRWQALLGLDRVGSGNLVNYTEDHVRLLVSYMLTGRTLGDGSDNAVLRRLAAEEMADHEIGFVVISEGLVGWSPSVSLATFHQGATVIPVPRWM